MPGVDVRPILKTLPFLADLHAYLDPAEVVGKQGELSGSGDDRIVRSVCAHCRDYPWVIVPWQYAVGETDNRVMKFPLDVLARVVMESDLRKLYLVLVSSSEERMPKEAAVLCTMGLYRRVAAPHTLCASLRVSQRSAADVMTRLLCDLSW